MGELSLLGKIEIIASPHPNNTEMMSVYATSSTRDEVIHVDTRPDETCEQFGLRLRGVIKALYNSPVKKEIQEAEKDRKRREMLGSVTGIPHPAPSADTPIATKSK